MRIVFNILLLAVAAVLAFLLYRSIEEPIAFSDVRSKRSEAVIERLREIRTAQEMYRDITGMFAPNFDTLLDVLRTQDFRLISVIGDPDDPNFDGIIRYDTTYRSALDSIVGMGIKLDSLRYVPYAPEGTTFSIAADTIEYQQTNVPVVEVGTTWKSFMGQYAAARFSSYDQKYKPNSVLKFGDMNRPSMAGNWE
jgi:hypothetical protein